jgi:Cytidylate kinase-like family
MVRRAGRGPQSQPLWIGDENMGTSRHGQFERLLDRQARVWESEHIEHPPAEAPTRPNLTISSPAHSGGDELGRRIAERLGWELYDRQIVEALHENDALGKSVLESLDERLLGFREDWIYHLFVPGHTATTAYIHRLSKLVFSIAMRGHNVFIGRGAGFIVPREWRLGVLVTESFDVRVAAYEKENEVSHTAARQALLRVDRMRDEFIARSFHRVVADPASHDLCVNLDSLGIDAATEIVLRALEVRFPHAELRSA